jgi:hypothetical protein
MTSYDEIKLYHAMKKRYMESRSEELIEKNNREIDEEVKRRNKKNSIADDPSDYGKGRQMGEQDIGDISYKVPWQHIVREQTGITVPINTEYECPVCGMKYSLDMPPDRCFRCNAKSFLHLKKCVNLKV